MNILGIFGAGGQGIEILDLARRANDVNKMWDGYVFINNGDEAPDIQGVKVMSLDRAISEYGNGLSGVLAVGEPMLREKISSQFMEFNIPRANVIAPDIYIPTSTSVGTGVVIFPGVYVGVNTVIGNNIMISPNAVIGHDVTIEDNVIVGATSVLCGMVHVKRGGYVGPGVKVKESLTIGERSVAALGSVIFKDIPDGELCIGNPGRISRRSEERLF